MRNSFAALCVSYAVGVAGAIAFGESDASNGTILPALALVVAGVGLVGLVPLAEGRFRQLGWLWAGMCLAAFGGGLRMESLLAQSEANPTFPSVRAFEAQVETRQPFGDRTRLRVRNVWARDGGDRLPKGLDVWLANPARREVRPIPEAGDRLWLRGRVTLLSEPANPGESDRSARLSRMGIGGSVSIKPHGWVRLAPAQDRIHWPWQRLRDLAARRIGDGPNAGLVRALGIGDRSALSFEARERFSQLGLSHLIAVSGLHLAWVGLLVCVTLQQVGRLFPFLGARFDVRAAAQGFALVVVAGYAAVTGFAVPVQRALILVVVGTLAGRAAHPGPRGQALWLAAAFVLFLDPSALMSPGAQLSFAACGALVYCGGRKRKAAGPVWFRALEASAVATAATSPLAALHFGVSAPFGLLANAVAIPWVTLALLPASGLACFAVGLRLPGRDWLLGVALDLAGLTHFVLNAFADSVPTRGSAPMATGAWSFGVSLALAALWVRSSWLRIGLVVGMGIVFHGAPMPKTGEGPRITVLDVGRGDAILVQAERGSMLVDAGSAVPGRFDHGAARVVPAARALGIERFDLVVATHADLDHRGGLPAVLEQFPVGELWLPRGQSDDPGFQRLVKAARRREVPVFERGLGDATERRGGLAVTPIWPPPGTSSLRGTSRNEASLALRVVVSGRRILLRGDLGRAEARLLQAIPSHDLASDVMVLPHHGSRGSSGNALLRSVGASVLIVSAPCPAVRGLPHPEALARAAETAAPLWWTGRDGAVSVALPTLRTTGFRSKSAAPVAPQESSCRTSR